MLFNHYELISSEPADKVKLDLLEVYPADKL